jgi:signal transduction histidine kinase
METPGDNNDRRLRDNGLTFFGSITASVTHELNNVMSIIEQMAGLLDDLCAGAEYGRPIENDKLREISEKIIKQIERGVGIIKRLNVFAHSVDDPVKEFELDALVKNLVELCQRFATLKRVQVEGQYPAEAMVIRSNPFVLEQAVFICIDLALSFSERDELVTVAIGDQDPGACVAVTGPSIPENEGTLSKRSLLKALMDQLHGEVQVESDEGRSTFKLSIPHFTEEVTS